LQYLYAFDFAKRAPSAPPASTSQLSQASKALGATEALNGFTYQAFPLGKHQVLLRLENLLDKLDPSNSGTATIDLQTLAQELYTSSNPGVKKAPAASIEEMRISGAQPLQEAAKKAKEIDLELA